mgnify:CR=1 FL=1
MNRAAGTSPYPRPRLPLVAMAVRYGLKARSLPDYAVLVTKVADVVSKQPLTYLQNLGGATDPKRKVKDLYTGREIGGQVAILDPAATVHTPEWLWLSTGLRAIDHAVEM